MGSLIDLTGKRFGRLVVIRRNYPNGKRKEPKWLCKCDCDKEKIIYGVSLRVGHTQSCGCFNKECTKNRRTLPSGFANMRVMISNYKYEAKRRGYEYKLTEAQFAEITKQACYYCGAKPNGVYKGKGMNGEYIYNGIDRVNNIKGYEIRNVVSCCKRCNQAKNDSTLQEFKNWIERIYNKMFGEKK